MVKKNSNLTAEQKLVMFEDGTEPPGTSELNNEKREGSYHCANCGIKLFNSLVPGGSVPSSNITSFCSAVRFGFFLFINL